MIEVTGKAAIGKWTPESVTKTTIRGPVKVIRRKVDKSNCDCAACRGDIPRR